jgi:hypothetical protein
MIGERMPETCWAVFKRQEINLRDWCIWLVDSFKLSWMFLYLLMRKTWVATANFSVVNPLCLLIDTCISYQGEQNTRLLCIHLLHVSAVSFNHLQEELKWHTRNCISWWSKNAVVDECTVFQVMCLYWKQNLYRFLTSACRRNGQKYIRISIILLFYFFIIFNLRTAAFKAYCAIWVRRSNFRHQASPRLSPRRRWNCEREMSENFA